MVEKHLVDTKVGVIGSGSFGTANVKMLLENCQTVHWLVHDKKVISSLEVNGNNPNYLTSVHFDINRLKPTTDVNEVISSCDVIILVTPSIYLSATLEKINVDVKGKLFVSAIKGIVPEHNDIVANYLRDRFQIGYRNQGVIAGPCHAEEVAMERLSYLTVAAAHEEDMETLSKIYSSRYIKVNKSNDILGNEYAAILKNVYAIGSGIACGLGYGDNFQAVLVSNAIREMKVFLDAVYPEPRNVNDSAYLGDLLVTAYSLFSRNRQFGNLVGKGYTVKSAIQSMNMVAEGYYATKGVQDIIEKKKINAPVVSTIYRILYEEKNAEAEFKELTQKLN